MARYFGNIARVMQSTKRLVFVMQCNVTCFRCGEVPVNVTNTCGEVDGYLRSVLKSELDGG
jgi:hypothetical protein